MSVGAIIISCLPGLLLISDSSLTRFIIQYLFIMLPLSFITGWIVSSKKIYTKSLLRTLLVLFTFIIPFFLLAAYPFRASNFLTTLILLVFGAALPFWSRNLTLWFYTIGGIFPLPAQHSWLLSSDAKANNYRSQRNLKTFIGIGVALGYTLYSVLSNKLIVDILLVLKLLSIVSVFGLGMTIGADLKKRSLKIELIFKK